MRCPKLAASSSRLVPAQPPPAGVRARYDCRAEYSDAQDTQEGWSEKKQLWCCDNEGLGCAVSYKCREGLKDWVQTWSSSKKKWCCRHRGLGCQQQMVDFGKKFDRPAADESTVVVPSVSL